MAGIFLDWIDNARIKEYLLADWKSDLEITRKVVSADYADKMLQKAKGYFEEQQAIINALNFSKIYQQADIVADISEFDLQDKFSPHYHYFIPIIYWLKTFNFIVEQAVKQKKSIIHIMIYP